MPRENESAILDSARVHLTRLIDALERGTAPGRSRRMLPRLTASLVLAALSCAGCVGYSYVSNNLDSLRQTTTPGQLPAQTLEATPDQDPRATAEEPSPTPTRKPLAIYEDDQDDDQDDGYSSRDEEGTGGSDDEGTGTEEGTGGRSLTRPTDQDGPDQAPSPSTVPEPGGPGPDNPEEAP